MKKLFVAAVAFSFLSAPAFAESVKSIAVDVPADLTAEGAADTARADLLEASKKVCRKARRSANTTHLFISLGDYESCVKTSYNAALAEDETGALVASATAANDPYLVASAE